MPETYRYPKPIKPWIGTEEEDTIDIETKRERIGQFIGLKRGVVASTAAAVTGATGLVETVVYEKDQRVDVDGEDDECEDEEEEDVVRVICEWIRAQMQKDWEEALERARRDEGYSSIVRHTKA